MKVLNICSDDWAGFACDNMRALISIGIECNGSKLNFHEFGYSMELHVVGVETIKEQIRNHDVIQFFHDNTGLFQELLPTMRDKKIIVYHTSSHYRKNYEQINAVMNPHVHRSVCAMPEFMGKGAKNEIYMVGAVNDYFSTYGGTTRFSHFPSNPSIKGTSRIVKLFEDQGLWILHSELPRKHHQQIFLMQGCLVYVEMHQLIDGNGMPYGNFGMTALEAASMGKVVVTNCLNLDIYEKAYGKIGLQVCNTEQDFIETINKFNGMDAFGLRKTMESTREWFLKNHSYKASGEYIIKNILN